MAQLDLSKHRLDHHIAALPPFTVPPGGAPLGAGNRAAEPNLVHLHPRSLDDLRAWIGVPNDAVDHDAHGVPLRAVAMDALPTGPFRFDELEPEQQEAVEALSHNLLFGRADPDVVGSAPAAHVVQHLLDVNDTLIALTGTDLVVQDGQTYTVSCDTCVFDSITLHGTGEIALQCDCKIITESLTYVAD